MKAILLNTAGGSEALKMTEIEVPELSDSHFIRIRLHAAGINPVDFKMRNKGGMAPDNLPIILGCDGAGVVEAIGEAVTRFKVGDEVYFFNGGIGTKEQGNYAEYTTVHEEYVALKPKKVSMQEAAALPLAWLTAWESLIDRAQLQAHQTVLIHAGAGGVGHLAVQLAKSKGARIAVTISSPEKAQFAESLGADYCIDYTQTDFVQATLDWTNGEGVDVVFDTVGGDIFCRSLSCLRIYGKIVTLLEPPCENSAIKLAKFRNLSLIYELMLTPMIEKMHETRIAQREMIEEASRLIEEEALQIKVTQSFPLSEVGEAHKLIETGHISGKIVLTMV
jgi:NADPH:quinone reductase